MRYFPFKVVIPFIMHRYTAIKEGIHKPVHVYFANEEDRDLFELMYMNFKRTRYNRFVRRLCRDEMKANNEKGRIKWSIAEVGIR